MYDSVRILGLRITTEIDCLLIKLSQAPQNSDMKSSVIKAVICFCYNSMLLKQMDRHLQANINNFTYSMTSFADVLSVNNLTQDF